MRNPTVNRRWTAVVLASALSACFAAAQAQTPAQNQAPRSTLRLVSETPYPAAAAAPRMSEQELRDTAIDAYVYAYPMVLMELARRQAAVQSPADGKAPMNQFGHKTAFPDPTATGTPWPSADALHSSLWFDVSRAPLIVRLPDAGGRYTLLSALDMWSDVFASRGTRTNGNGAQSFAIVGPDWQGTLPPGVDLVRSPTATGWLIGWTQAGGPQDYAAVNQIQSSMSASPLISAAAPPSTRLAARRREVGMIRIRRPARASARRPSAAACPCRRPCSCRRARRPSRRPRWMRPRSSRCSLTRCAITRRTPTTVPCSTACAASAWTTGAPSTSAA